VIKLIISLLFFILLSCEQISKDKVLNKIENTKDIIEEKTNENITKIKESNNKNKKNEQIDNKIFYFIGDPYYIEGVKYIPEENYTYEEVGLATYYDKKTS
jgi:hypothetical protein